MALNGQPEAKFTLKMANCSMLPSNIKPPSFTPTPWIAEDIAVAECEDSFTVTGEKLGDYSFSETPSSPQFFLYSIGSPEDAAIWHGVGAFGFSTAASELLFSPNGLPRRKVN